MNKINQLIEDQYYLPNLYENILNKLKEQGLDLNKISRSHISGVDELHVRGAEVSKELVREFNLTGLKVLDVGCGIGGPSRMLADEFDCNVYGIDMSHEFIRTAKELSKIVNIRGNTNFVQGDALDLPFENESFDVVWTQHVQMNIEDKEKFYKEIKRVLKKGGSFIYYDIFKKENHDVNYPVPWANDKSVSFLQTISNMDGILNNLGFSKTKITDQTEKGIEFFENLFEKIKQNGPPKLGLNILMGAATKEKLGNVLHSLKENRIELQSGIYQK